VEKGIEGRPVKVGDDEALQSDGLYPDRAR
jgi:hypothetical protein